MDEKQFNDLVKQVSDANGRDTDATRGFTLRELVLMTYEDVQTIKEKYPSRGEIYTVLGIALSTAGIILANI